MPLWKLSTADLVLLTLHHCSEAILFPTAEILHECISATARAERTGEDFFSGSYLSTKAGLEADVAKLVAQRYVTTNTDRTLVVSSWGKKHVLDQLVPHQGVLETVLLSTRDRIRRRMEPRGRSTQLGSSGA